MSKSYAKSDKLQDLNILSDVFSNPLLPFLSKIIRAKIIIDANIAYSAILWMASKRRNPEAQTDIVEIARTGFAEIHAPQFLKKEVEKHIPEIAEESDKTVSEIKSYWNEFSSYICYHDTSRLPSLEEDVSDIDPKDAPYIQLQKHLNHPIISRDKHISEMGGNVMDIVVVNRLRDVYRLNTIEYQVAITGYGVVFVGSHVITGLVNLVKEGISKLTNMPDWVHLIMIFAFIVVYKDPRLNEKFSNYLKLIFLFIPDLAEEIIRHTGTAFKEMQNAKTKSAEIVKQLPADFKHVE